jgi:hypothetical protein
MTESKITVEDPEKDLGTEYCEFCEQNFPVRVRVVSNLDAGVHLQISGYHIHMSMNGEPIPLAPRLIRIEDLDDFKDIGKLLKAETIRVAKEVEARDAQRALEPPEPEKESCGCPDCTCQKE